MRGDEHYKAAERWLYKAEQPGARGIAETTESCSAIANVHATLALAAAVALKTPSRSRWGKVAGRQEKAAGAA